MLARQRVFYKRNGIPAGGAMKRWSKLQRQLYLILDDIGLQIHCSVYCMNSQRGGTDLPRYWITLGKEILFDYPKVAPERGDYPYMTEVSDISALFREYLDTPKEQLPAKRFDDDRYGLTDLLKAADARLGPARLEEYFRVVRGENADVVKRILRARRQKKCKDRLSPGNKEQRSS